MSRDLLTDVINLQRENPFKKCNINFVTNPLLASEQPLTTLLAHQFASTFVRGQQLLWDAGTSPRTETKNQKPQLSQRRVFGTHALRGGVE